jgi:hypothetical protein
MLWIWTLKNYSLKAQIRSHAFNFWNNNQSGFNYTQIEIFIPH